MIEYYVVPFVKKVPTKMTLPFNGAIIFAPSLLAYQTEMAVSRRPFINLRNPNLLEYNQKLAES